MQVPEFAYLGHGASLVQLLSRDSAALECVSGSLQGSAAAPLDQVCQRHLLASDTVARMLRKFNMLMLQFHKGRKIAKQMKQCTTCTGMLV